MKLDTPLRQNVERQLGIQAVPERHPAAPDLKEKFGDHTFFVDTKGLSIVEPNPSPESFSANLVRIASWAKGGSELQGHEPEVQEVTVDLEPDEPDPAA